MSYRTTELDNDTRPEPRTDRYCIKCQRDIKPGAKARVVHVVDGGANVLHPSDEIAYAPDNGDLGCHLVGMKCARRIGLEWSVPEQVNKGFI